MGAAAAAAAADRPILCWTDDRLVLLPRQLLPLLRLSLLLQPLLSLLQLPLRIRFPYKEKELLTLFVSNRLLSG